MMVKASYSIDIPNEIWNDLIEKEKERQQNNK